MRLMDCGIKCLNEAFAKKSSSPSVIDYTRGVIFLSTPQRTSPEVQWATLLTRCAIESMPPGLTPAESSDLEDLTWATRSENILHELSKGFNATVTKKMKIFSFYEGVPMPAQYECVS